MNNEAPNPAGMDELNALSTIVRALQSFDEEAKRRVLQSVTTLLGLSDVVARSSFRASSQPPTELAPEPARFSEDRRPSPKEFLHDKKPRTDVERVACLAYYLTHYRDTPHFKTLDISKLNTEAAQLKFSNAAYSVDNATKSGFLVPAMKGNKQLSAVGELYVQALPDRAAAKAVLSDARPRRNRRPPRSVKNAPRSEQ